MTTVNKNFSYVEAAFEFMPGGDEQSPFWRGFHWGLFSDPENMDNDPGRYYAAAEAMTEAVVTAAGVADGRRILDVGCGFGGTLDHIANRNKDCQLAGINVDEQQLIRARGLLAEHGRGGVTIPFVTADGCRLPIASGTLDHVLAVECLFHFPSRKLFFKEVARVLKPGGTLAITDFIAAPGALHAIVTRTAQSGLGDNSWYGHQSKPPTVQSYERLARSVGVPMIVDQDVTQATMPTYPALRNLYEGAGFPEGAASVDSLEDLARSGDLGYHVVAFQKN
jgi:ubiquinone/menaquinone biosynthesis C-methylase UbiE